MKDYYISTEKKLISINKVWILLKNCFWSKNIPMEYVERLIKYSLCFGVFKKDNNELVGFGRVISDYTTYAYICDIIIDLEHQGKGLGVALVEEIMNHSELRSLKTWSLTTTAQARKIYERFGFKITEEPNNHLEINDLEIYSSSDFVNIHKK